MFYFGDKQLFGITDELQLQFQNIRVETRSMNIDTNSNSNGRMFDVSQPNLPDAIN